MSRYHFPSSYTRIIEGEKLYSQAMDNGVSGVVLSQENNCLYPMLFGVSCTFFALKLLSEHEMSDEKLKQMRNVMLQGSAHILGLLVSRKQSGETKDDKCELVHKLEVALNEVEELKKRRSEDARANEKVVGIFASQEQVWFSERKKLRLQIGALVTELRVLENKKDELISELKEKLQEKELSLQSESKIAKEEGQKRVELEAKLRSAENTANELRENAKREAQRHSADLSRHKTAFIELVSNQRQLEAEMGRALRQVEAAKQELDLVLKQKDQSVLTSQKLSMELVKAHKDLEQKDKVLSAMLRKSKLDMTEKQMLLKEVKLSKARKKQTEVETQSRREVSESRNETHSLRSILSRHADSKPEAPPSERGLTTALMSSGVRKSRSRPSDLLPECGQSDLWEETEVSAPLYDRYWKEGSDKLVIAADANKLEGWVRSEAEKCTNTIEQRHHLEITAFAEQLRLKDEKLETFRWRLLSMELESKRLHSYIEELDHDLAQFKDKNMRLEALILEREAELHSLKEQLALHFNTQCCQEKKPSSHDLKMYYDSAVRSKVKMLNKNSGEKEQEKRITCAEIPEKEINKKEEIQPKDQPSERLLTVQSSDEEKETAIDQDSTREEHSTREFLESSEKLALTMPCSSSNKNSFKMDLQALGISFKIKRLKHQLIVLDRLTGKQDSCEDTEGRKVGNLGVKTFYILMSLLNKQVSRYQSLHEKTGDLSKRMQENGLSMNARSSDFARTREEKEVLEHFLEETFQLQRYTVATGQKLMEIQSKIASEFTGAAGEVEKPSHCEMRRFADGVGSLFREVQRGLEIRIARIIGDLEGTLACDGLFH